MQPPAMAATDIARYPTAPVRVNCYLCARCLYAGDDVPDGGADAVYQAAGCHDDPRTCPGPGPDRPTAAPSGNSRIARQPATGNLGGATGAQTATPVTELAASADALLPPPRLVVPAPGPSRLARTIRRATPGAVTDAAASRDEPAHPTEQHT